MKDMSIAATAILPQDCKVPGPELELLSHRWLFFSGFNAMKSTDEKKGAPKTL